MEGFCRTFDFELQAAANDDGILLSLGEQHSFPLADVFDFLNPKTVEQVLTQAVLQAPMFGTRFRWVSSRALARPVLTLIWFTLGMMVCRYSGGRPGMVIDVRSPYSVSSTLTLRSS